MVAHIHIAAYLVAQTRYMFHVKHFTTIEDIPILLPAIRVSSKVSFHQGVISQFACIFITVERYVCRDAIYRVSKQERNLPTRTRDESGRDKSRPYTSFNA